MLSVVAPERAPLVLFEDPALSAPRNWIRKRLRDQGKTQSELARFMGKSESSISRALDGKRPFTETEIRTIARFLGLAASVVLENIGGNVALSTVPIAGFICAGGFIVTTREECPGGLDVYPELESVEPPPGLTNATPYLVVDNRDVPKFDVGELVFAVPDTPARLVDRECVVTLADGRRLVRFLRPSAFPGRFTLVSRTGALEADVELAGAAAIEWIRPAGGVPFATC